MSHVTDLVFIIPGTYNPIHRGRFQMQFEHSFAAAHNLEIHPQEGGGGKVTDCTVYIHGVNWINQDWIAEIRAMDWPHGTVLWLDDEGLMDQPRKIDVYQLGPEIA